MSVVKIKKKTSHFSVIDTRFFNDTRLTWKAKGLLGYLLSKPDDWKVRMKDLEKRSPKGIREIKSGMKELIRYGYAEMIRKQTQSGKFQGTEYVIYEESINKIDDSDSYDESNDEGTPVYDGYDLDDILEDENNEPTESAVLPLSVKTEDGKNGLSIKRTVHKTDCPKTAPYSNNESIVNIEYIVISIYTKGGNEKKIKALRVNRLNELDPTKPVKPTIKHVDFYNSVENLAREMCDYFHFKQSTANVQTILKSLLDKAKSAELTSEEIISNWGFYKQVRQNTKIFGYDYKSIYKFISEGLNYDYEKIINDHNQSKINIQEQTEIEKEEARLNKLRQFQY